LTTLPWGSVPRGSLVRGQRGLLYPDLASMCADSSAALAILIDADTARRSIVQGLMDKWPN